MQEKAPKFKLQSKIQNQGFTKGAKIKKPNFQIYFSFSPQIHNPIDKLQKPTLPSQVFRFKTPKKN